MQEKWGFARTWVTALLAGAAFLASPQAMSQAHGPPATEFADTPETDDPATLAGKLEAIEEWLTRLAGRFRLSSAVNSRRPGLLVDCVRVGEGPGVHCTTGRGGNTPPGEDANASMQLYGVDPLALAISRLTVNGRGIAQHAQGKLRADTLVFPRTNCVIPENTRTEMRIILCQEVLKIRALANGQELQFTTETFQLVLPPSRPAGMARGVGSRTVNSTSTVWMKRVPQATD